ncbi:MAG: MBL fold metallo-hydrolase [Candidatus Latescibacterota bacterium]
MEICILGSGSKGNCVYVEHRGAALLIDQGFSWRELAARMSLRGIDPSRIKAIFVSHEHNDHVAGVGIAARKLDVPVYATRGTFEGRKNIFNGDESLRIIEGGVPLTLGSLEILPFTVSHDSNEPVQFSVNSGKRKLSIATDLGFVSTLVEYSLRDSNLVVLEANHDVEMLKRGSYPWALKQRILGRTGHLSNRNAAELLFNLSRQHPVKAVLAHLSEENNQPEIAEKEVRELFENYDSHLSSLTIALQSEPTFVMEI